VGTRRFTIKSIFVLSISIPSLDITCPKTIPFFTMILHFFPTKGQMLITTSFQIIFQISQAISWKFHIISLFTKNLLMIAWQKAARCMKHHVYARSEEGSHPEGWIVGGITYFHWPSRGIGHWKEVRPHIIHPSKYDPSLDPAYAGCVVHWDAFSQAIIKRFSINKEIIWNFQDIA